MKPTDQIIIENLQADNIELRKLIYNLVNSVASYLSDTTYEGEPYTSQNILRGDLEKAKEILK